MVPWCWVSAPWRSGPTAHLSVPASGVDGKGMLLSIVGTPLLAGTVGVATLSGSARLGRGVMALRCEVVVVVLLLGWGGTVALRG